MTSTTLVVKQNDQKVEVAGLGVPESNPVDSAVSQVAQKAISSTRDTYATTLHVLLTDLRVLHIPKSNHTDFWNAGMGNVCDVGGVARDFTMTDDIILSSGAKQLGLEPADIVHQGTAVATQIAGYTSVLSLPLGVLWTKGAYDAHKQAALLGDTRGKRLEQIGMAQGVLLSGFGGSFAAMRVANIGMRLEPTASAWSGVSSISGFIGLVFVALVELFGSVKQGLTAFETARFGKKFKEEMGKGDESLLKWLNNQFGLSSETSESKKTEEEVQQIGKDNLEELLNLLPEDVKKKLAERGLDAVLTEENTNLTKSLGEMEIGDRLKGKKIAKMERVLGKEKYQQVLQELQIEKPDVTRIKGIVKINEVSKTLPSHFTKKILKHLGWALIGLLLVTSLAGMAASSFISAPMALTVVCLALFILGSAFEIGRGVMTMKEKRNDESYVPRKHDTWLSFGGIGLAVAGLTTTIVLASIFSMGIAPIIVGVGLAMVACASYAGHIWCVNSRRKDHLAMLMDKARRSQLSLEEYHYLCSEGSDKWIEDNGMGLVGLNQKDKELVKWIILKSNKDISRDELLVALEKTREQQILIKLADLDLTQKTQEEVA